MAMFFIKSDIKGFEFEVETDEIVEDDDDFDTYCFDELEEIVQSIIDNLDCQIDMPFSEERITESFVEQACLLIDDREDYYVTSYSKEGNLQSKEIKIPIDGYLKNRIISYSEDCSFTAMLTGKIEDVLLGFVNKASWHIDSDSVWFGINGNKSPRPWIIDSQTEDSDLAFWFETQSWEFMEYLGDFSKSFLIWYTAECVCSIPDMDEIRSACPISLEKNDTVLAIMEKIKQYNSMNDHSLLD